MTKLCMLLNTPEKVDQRLLFFPFARKKRQSTKLKGRKLEANNKKDSFFLHDGLLELLEHIVKSWALEWHSGAQMENVISRRQGSPG